MNQTTTAPLGYYQNRETHRVLAHMGFDDNQDYLMAGILQNNRTFAVRKVDVEKKYEPLPGFTLDQVERQTCGRRMSDFGPQERTENLDYWEIEPNGDKTCSYCGSASWEVFNGVIDKVIAGEEGYRVESTDKGYKFYIRQPGVANAAQGAIKFYVHHVPRDLYAPEGKERLQEAEGRLNEAIKRSNAIWRQRFEQRHGE